MRRLTLAVLLLLAQTLWASAEERAESFLSEVELFADGTVHVSETIDVTVEGVDIKHGLVRTFPLAADATVESASRDGAPEPFLVTDGHGKREIRVGRADVLLTHGLHHYVIAYRMKAPLNRLPNGDMMFFPVTGSWKFPFEKAAVKLQLPPSAIIANAFASVHPVGGPERPIPTPQANGNRFSAETARRLEPGDAFTIAVLWQKGVIAEEKKAP